MAEPTADVMPLEDEQPAAPGSGPAPRLWGGSLHLAGWLLVAGLAVCLCGDPPQWFYCRCGFGSVKYHATSIGYGLVAVRAVVAVLLRERSRGWIAELILLALLAPLVDVIVTAAGGH